MEEEFTARMTELDCICFEFRALKFRPTSHIEDEPFHLIILLDFELNELMEVPESYHLQSFGACAPNYL